MLKRISRFLETDFLLCPVSLIDGFQHLGDHQGFLRLHQRLGSTIIYVTHDQTEAMTLGSRIVVMKDGVVQQIDSPQNLYNNPVNVFVAGFIGVSNFVDCDIRTMGPADASAPSQTVSNPAGPSARTDNTRGAASVPAQALVKGTYAIPARLGASYNGKGIISARPEQLFFSEKEGIPGRIVISTFLGDFIEYEIELDDGQTLQLNEYTKDVHTVRPDGERVLVNFNTEAVSIYNADTLEVISC